MKLYSYNKCGTCHKAKKLLDAKKVSYDEIDITKIPPPKSVLKKALKGILPDAVLSKKKSGFNAPVGVAIQTHGMDEFRAFNKYVFDKFLQAVEDHRVLVYWIR